MTGVQQSDGEWFEQVPGWSRWQRFVAAAMCVAFVALVGSVPMLGFVVRPVRTQSSVPAPEWTWKAFYRGDAMRQWERHVKEDSWLTFELRGAFNEALFAIDQLESDRVVIGKDGWLYLAETLRWFPEALERSRQDRRNVWTQALLTTRALGMQLLVVPVPDRVTIYPEHLPADRRLPPGRERLYDEILDDLRAVGVPFVDLRALFLEHKKAHPDVLLYYRRDTHWNLAGTLLAADAVRHEIEARGWSALVVPSTNIVVEPTRVEEMVPGLVRMLGLRAEVGAGVDRVSGVVRRLTEPRSWRPVRQRDAAGNAGELATEQPTASVVLCGTSFSEALGYQLPGALGALVDRRCVIAGGGSFSGIRKLAGELGKGGFAPKILVWEFVQRDYLDAWLVVKALLE